MKSLLINILLLNLLFSQFLWDNNGVPILQSTNKTFNHESITFGSSNEAIIVWTDLRNGDADIYAQKINSEGHKLWDLHSNLGFLQDDISDGLPITNSPLFQMDPKITINGNGGAYILFKHEFSTNEYQLRLQQISSDGELLFPENGILISEQFLNYKLIEDGTGGVFIIWKETSDENSPILITNVNTNGEMISPNYVTTLPSESQSYQLELIESGLAGITWTATNSIYSSSIFLNIINLSCNSILPISEGIIAIESTDPLSNPNICKVNNEQFAISWQKENNYGLFLKYFDFSGNPLNEIITINANENKIYHYKIIGDNFGTYVIFVKNEYSIIQIINVF